MALDLELVAKMGASLATIAAAATAIYGVSAWRREHIGKRKAELAEETLVNFYHAADVIRMMRAPERYTDEGTSRKAPRGESAEEKTARDRAHIAIERYNSSADLFSRLRAARYRFMAFFGRQAAKPFEDLNAIILEIFLAAQMLGDLWAERAERVPSAKAPDLREQIRHYQRIIWRLDDPDPIDRRVEAIIADIERTCRSVILEAGRTKWLVDLIRYGREQIERAQRE